MVYKVMDALQVVQNFSTSQDPSGNLVGSTCIADPSTGQKASVQQFHAADGQALGTGYGIYTGGVEVEFNGTTYDRSRAVIGDAQPMTGIGADGIMLWNGATMDRQRGNVDTGALVTLTAAAAGGNSADQINYNGRGLQLVIDITAITGTSPTLTVTIQGKDTASGKYYTLLASAALSAVATTLLTVYPGAAATANVSAPQVLPRTFRILYAIGGTTPAVTATIGASVIV